MSTVQTKKTPLRETKAFGFQAKEFDDATGTVKGYLATFDNVDLGLDRIRSGAFKRTLQNKYHYKKTHNTHYLFPLLWQHDTNEPIGGYLEAKEDSIGLYVEFQTDLDVQRGKEAYSALKKGYIFQQSIGYDVIAAEYVKDADGRMIRDLLEIRLWEGSVVTLPMNEQAVITDVKSASGKTSWPLADYDTEWTGSKATSQLFSWAKTDDGDIQSSKARQGFLWYDPDQADVQAGYKMPFCYVEGDGLKIIPKGVLACANVLSGGMGGLKGVSDADIASMKSKIKTMYGRINKQFDKDLTVPWEQDGKARSTHSMPQKDFNDHYREEVIRDWLCTDFYNLTCALQKAVLDIFTIGDTPQTDIDDTILEDGDDSPGFISALKAYVQKGIDLDVSNYLNEMNSTSSPYSYYGYMSNQQERLFKTLAGKAMTESDATTGGFTSEHVNRLKSAVSKMQTKVKAHVSDLHDAADSVAALIGKKPQGEEDGDGDNDNDSNEKRVLPLAHHKAGRTFSGANAQALSDHVDDLHDKADIYARSMGRQMKAINNVADDLAQILQGAEAAYGTEPGDAGDRQQGKGASSHAETRAALTAPSSLEATAQASHAQEDTVSEDELATIRALRSKHQLLTS